MMQITPDNKELFQKLLQECLDTNKINPNLYIEYDVKRGLRDSNGEGVLTGLTEISDVSGTENVNGKKIPVDGKLYYQGYEIRDIVEKFQGHRFRFEEITYLLLFGELPTKHQLVSFIKVLHDLSELSGSFVRDVIMKATTTNLMNSLMKSVLTLYSYDEDPDNTSAGNVLRQSLQLIGKLPLISCYAYQSYMHFKKDGTLMIKNPRKDYSVAENILYMLREDGKFTPLEAEVLDICLVTHAEHGGGNNSTFTNRVVTSSGTDTYSAIAAAIASLKGFRHGGANLQVHHMFDNIKKNVSDWEDVEEVKEYLGKILDKQAFDGAGLIYGMGHAVYSLSDPREKVFKAFVEQLAAAKGRDEDMTLYNNIEKIAPKLIAKERKIYKGVSPNVDFYSGFVYEMLGIPRELYTPLFAVARIVGWSAHRIEELVTTDKIIRPAYKSLVKYREYVDRDAR